MLEIPVDGGVHRHRLDSKFTTRPQNTQRDFAAIGDHNFIEHTGSALRR